jgi:hypothetical protein
VRGKENDIDFLHFIKQHDIVTLLETWSNEPKDFQTLSDSLSEFDTPLVKHGVKLSKHGRLSSGILVYIKHSLSHLIKYSSDFECGIICELSEQLLGYPTLFIACYLPPSGSNFYNRLQTSGISLLENKLNELRASHPGYKFIISGDLNARTNNLQDFIQDDSSKFLPLPDFYPESSFCINRKSKDIHGEVNEFGKALLELCCTFDIHMLNGRVKGDKNGELTCFTATGSSVVDYTIVSAQLYDRVLHFKIEEHDQFTHFPQSITFASLTCTAKTDERTYSSGRQRLCFKWTDESMEKLITSDLIPTFYSNIEAGDTEEAAKTLTTLIQDISQGKQKKQKKTYLKQQPWWDSELDMAKSVKYKCLRYLKKTNHDVAKSKYRTARNRFKALVKIKKSRYKKQLREKLESCKSSSDFWKFIKTCKKSMSCANVISGDEWKTYFSQLFNNQPDLNVEFQENIQNYMIWHDMNCNDCKEDTNVDDLVNKDISLIEVEDAVDDLVTNKAPGIDGIDNDILKKSKLVIAPMLCSLFNKLLEKGCYPEEWCSAIIVPIYKKGDVRDANNYRGVSLLSCISKLFTKVLNKRLNDWAIENDKMFDVQGGFTKGKSTTDQIFVFQTLVSKYLNKEKGRFYSVFIDFSKAFDSVPHQHLFYSLISRDLHGRVINLLRNMYSKLRSCVLINDGYLCDDFSCSIGTRQGCMISPFLFVFYLNELIHLAEEEHCQGIYVSEEHPNVNMLLYADDIVIVGDHIGRVQKLLNTLSKFCSNWGLQVNMQKSKFMVFRNGGIIKKNEVLYYNGIRLKYVTYYKYLGVLISTRLSWSPAQVTLSLQASKALHVISEVNYKCDYSFSVACDLFDKCIVPILTYGSEIWGVSVHNSIESLHNKFCKMQLGVGSSTPTPAVLGECGRDHMYIACLCKCIKYWLKLISLPADSLLGSCYAILYRQSLSGKTNWASKIRDILFRYGFGWIWENQNVIDVYSFLKIFTERVKDCELQSWSSEINEVSKLRTYCLFKDVRSCEMYLSMSIPRKLRVSLARFRTGSHRLEMEIGRHHNIRPEGRLCKLCLLENVTAIEDEIHVLFHCSAYKEIRESYNFSTYSTLFDFVTLMKNNDQNVIVNLANFIYSMFKIRNCLFDDM